jgi:membrane protein YdbS with pleckstrin-like domain
MEKLHPGAKWAFRARGYFSFLWLIFLFIVPFGMVLSKNSDMVYFSFGYYLFAFLVVILISEVYARLSYNNWKYELTSNELKLERGIIWKRYSAIPYERVQNVDIYRGILARLLHFSTLNIQTAGYSAVQGRGMGMMSEGHIPAVSIKKAEEIREFLMSKISKKGI